MARWDPFGRGERLFKEENAGHDNVADDEHDEVGWSVVSAVMMQSLIT